MDESLLFDIEDRVAVLTINREKRRNALDDATLLAIEAALRACAGQDVGAVVLTGAGTRAFSAGSQPLGKQSALRAVHPLNKSLHQTLPAKARKNHSTVDVFTQPGS